MLLIAQKTYQIIKLGLDILVLVALVRCHDQFKILIDSFGLEEDLIDHTNSLLDDLD